MSELKHVSSSAVEPLGVISGLAYSLPITRACLRMTVLR